MITTMIRTMIAAISPTLTGWGLAGWGSAVWGGVFNHLWQSTVFAAVAALLALGLRKNHARARYWLWLAASCKFLVPFSMLVALGTSIGSEVASTIEKLWPSAPAIVAQPEMAIMIDEISQPFTQVSIPAAASEHHSMVPEILFGLWACGCAIVLVSWFRRWLRVRAAVRSANPIHLEVAVQPGFPHPDGWGWSSRQADGKKPQANAWGWSRSREAKSAAPTERGGIGIMSSPALIEPGIFGIFRPVLLLPEGIADRLTPAQLRSILAHELCHVKRRDNLAAAVHMIVEAAFWFHPLVWWIGARLVEERERACDEEVLLRGSEPGVYAESILQVCKFYLESPLKCVAGVTGSDLKKRIESIMSGLPGRNLSRTRKSLLVAASIGAIAGPVIVGVLTSPHIRAQSRASTQDRAHPAFEVASVKPSKSGDDRRMGLESLPGGGLSAKGVPLYLLITFAYDLPIQSSRIAGGPDWIRSDRFDIEARADKDAISPGATVKAREAKTRLMLQTLLAERFKLVIRIDKKELPVYAAVVGKNGSKLQKSKIDEKDCPDNGTTVAGTTCHTFFGGMGRGLHGDAVDMSDLVQFVANWADRPVIDKTGIQGLFNIQTDGWTRMVPSQPSPDGTVSDEAQALADPARPTLQMIFDRLGLKLEATKAPIDMYVIEHAEKPSDNFEPPVAAARAIQAPAQDGPALSFEVASIRPHQGTIIAVGLDISGTRVTVYASAVSDLVANAYNVKDYQVTGVADWMRSERYDIAAKAAGDSAPTVDQARRMLQTLLTERFHLKTHRETKEMPVYALVVGRNGPKLKENAAGPGILKFNPKGRDVELVAMGAPIDSLVNQLPRMPGVDRPVVDKTGLTGKYDFRITLTDFQLDMNAEQRGIPAADSVGASVFTALQEQLGLKLESTKAPVEVIVIDHVEKPSDNFEPPAKQEQALDTVARSALPPRVESPQTVPPQMTVVAKPQSKPAPPAEKPPAFEVADVKVNKSGGTDVEGQLLPGGQVRVRNMSMKMLITLAYHVRPNMISGGPGWLDSDRYDVVAKASPKSSEDELRVMMQTLLADRFRLKAHSEKKTLPAYALIVVTGGAKLGKPDATSQGDEDCTPGAGTGQTGEHHMVCYMGMEKLAEALPALAPGYFDRPVVDQTGLAGFYKVKLDWTGALQIDALGGRTIFGAVELLGLKLDSRKIAVPSIVIDHVERTPTEN